MSALIRFDRVGKSFGDNVVLRDLSLEVERGETMVILGGSGTGKSILLKMLIGLLRPDSGAVCFDGIDIARQPESELLPIRKRISMLFQGSALFDSLTVADNVAYPLHRYEHLSGEAIRARVEEMLELVGLPGEGGKTPAELSGGMKKRVALARALAAHPEVLLYDEPTTGLDPLNTRRISDLIRSMQERLHVTSLVVTHDLASASWVADRIALLAGGEIAAVLPPEDFLRSRHAAVRDFVSAMLPVPEGAAEAR